MNFVQYNTRDFPVDIDKYLVFHFNMADHLYVHVCVFVFAHAVRAPRQLKPRVLTTGRPGNTQVCLV